MKNNAITLLAAACVLMLSAGCDKNGEQPRPDVQELEKIILDTTEIVLEAGESYSFSVSTVPENAEVELQWESDDPSIVSVEKGTATAIAVGETSVRAVCGSISASCAVKVIETEAQVTGVSVTPSEAEIEIGEVISLEASVEPEGAPHELSWTSSNPDVASVDASGAVTGLSDGYAVIMAEAGGKTASCNITVTAGQVESVSLNETELRLKEGDTYTLQVIVEPEGARYEEISWESSDEYCVSVNGAGTVTALRGGNAVVSVNVDGIVATCNVEVESSPLSVGSLYYSDGTYSSVPDPDKEIIGVVFYVGDITSDDPALRKEHPGCTHGLVVAAEEINDPAWQLQYLAYGSSVGAWAEANCPEYESPLTDIGLSDNLNKTLGYNNTKVLEAFNASYENAAWPIGVMEALTDYRNSHQAPDGTSGWYIPSAKELSLLAAGDSDKNIIDFNSNSNIKLVNKVLEDSGLQIIGGSYLPYAYWSSTEISNEQAIALFAFNGGISITNKDAASLYRMRPILAF